MEDDLVFVCYSRKDQDFAIKLATILKNRGVPIWLDQWNIPSGANWNRSIENALKKSTHILLILTPSSVESSEVECEWNHALHEKKTIIPLRYKPCDIPFRLELIQYIDLVSRIPDDKEYVEQIMNALTLKTARDKQVPSAQYSSIDISLNIGEIRNQEGQGSSVGFAVAYAMQAAIRAKTGEQVVLSPQSIYNAARQYDGTPIENDKGTYLDSALKAMEKIGAYLESDWPYYSLVQNPGTLPAYRVHGFSMIHEVEEIIDAMKQGKIVLIGIEAPEAFASQDAKKSGRIAVDHPKKIIGGHAICLVGYDQNHSMFKFANSWGREWGEDGFGTINETDLSQILLNAYAIEP